MQISFPEICETNRLISVDEVKTNKRAFPTIKTFFPIDIFPLFAYAYNSSFSSFRISLAFDF